MLLQIQDSFEALTRTVADCIALRWSTEWPRALGWMAIRLAEELGVLLNLRLVEPLERAEQTRAVLLLMSEPALDEGLRDKSNVP